jgi:ABC-type nickel/cobalt efflux system permease component RcnA
LDVVIALFETDWTKELDQVHAVAKKIIDDDVSPMIDKKIGLINKHADELMRKSAFQADNLAKEMVKEIELQREKLVADVTKIALILLLGFTACSAALIWLFFFLKDGAHV